MEQRPILYGIIGLLAGSLLAVIVTSNAVSNNNTSMMRMMGIQGRMTMMDEHMEEEQHDEAHLNQRMSDMMNQMTATLADRKGDDFDKAFLTEMITHHQGAIEMANQAKLSAKHDELKRLAEDIIAAQTKEVEQMKAWQKMWGY